MLTAAENDLLTQTDAGTPMGEYFRRFWQPVALSQELPEADGAPLRVTVLGEQLIAFRDTEGRIGLVSNRCPHRGADLYWARNEECGLRCVYHGWKFDVTGRAVDLPNVPAGVRHHETVRIRAYPCREFGDIVWAYMGPAGQPGSEAELPPVPQFEFGHLPAEHRYVSKQLLECNWAQILEGGLDTSHFSFLHMPAPSVPSDENPDAPADARRLRWIRNDPMPQFSVLEHDVGFVVGGKRVADEEGDYWRITQFMLPSHGTGPSTLPGETYFGYTAVPITDEAAWVYVYAWNPERPIEGPEREKLALGHGIIAQVGPDFVPLRNQSNDFMIDRAVQKGQTFTGVRGLAEQDAMIQQSQGRIADRTQETLTATDAAVVRFRRVVMEGAQAVADTGRDPAAPWQADAYRTRPGSWLAAQGTSFEDVMLERFGHPLGRIAAE